MWFINSNHILKRTKKGRKQYLTIYQDEEKKEDYSLILKKEDYSLILLSILLTSTYFQYRERDNQTLKQINKHKE